MLATFAALSLTPLITHTPAPTDPLEGFKLLAGSWTTNSDDSPPMQETWMPAEGNNMTGVLRWYADDGTVRMYELMAITAEEDAVRLRIRHFDKRMNPWKSEADGPMILKLEESKNNVFVFEAETGTGALESMTYDLSTPKRSSVILRFEGDAPETRIDFNRMQD